MHNESNGDTIPLAAHRKALREAYVEARMIAIVEDNRADALRDEYEAEALARWPEPEPEPTVTHDGWTYRLRDGLIESHPEGGKGWGYLCRVDFVRALASLLPREPVAVTDETVRKAYDTWYNAPAGSEAFRLVAEAVAADLAGPVGAEKPKAQWWGVVDNEGTLYACGSKAAAEVNCREHDEDLPVFAPHRVVGLAEVEA